MSKGKLDVPACAGLSLVVRHPDAAGSSQVMRDIPGVAGHLSEQTLVSKHCTISARCDTHTVRRWCAVLGQCEEGPHPIGRTPARHQAPMPDADLGRADATPGAGGVAAGGCRDGGGPRERPGDGAVHDGARSDEGRRRGLHNRTCAPSMSHRQQHLSVASKRGTHASEEARASDTPLMTRGRSPRHCARKYMMLELEA